QDTILVVDRRDVDGERKRCVGDTHSRPSLPLSVLPECARKAPEAVRPPRYRLEPRSVRREPPDLDRAEPGDGMRRCDGACLLVAVALEQVEAGDELLRLRERPVGDERLAA